MSVNSQQPNNYGFNSGASTTSASGSNTQFSDMSSTSGRTNSGSVVTLVSASTTLNDADSKKVLDDLVRKPQDVKWVHLFNQGFIGNWLVCAAIRNAIEDPVSSTENMCHHRVI